MADEKSWENGRVGSFQLGRRYKDKNVETELGRLYEAHNVHTGAAALVLIPCQSLAWEPKESWEVRASSQVEPPHVVLQVERAPTSGQLRKLVEILDVLSASLKRVDENEQARTHLTDDTWRRLMRRAGLTRPRQCSWRWLAFAGLALVVLGVGVWSSVSEKRQSLDDENPASSDVAWDVLPYDRAPTLIDKPHPNVEVVAYPLPPRPFVDQAKGPCKPKEGEVEINGGCWVELAKLPPCYENQAEYQGKCYLPDAAKSHRPPQSVDP